MWMRMQAWTRSSSSRNGVAYTHPVWLGCEVHVVQGAHRGRSWRDTACKASCWPSANKSGIKASPCSPPSPCGIRWTVPSSSSHKYFRWRPVEHCHERECCVIRLSKTPQHCFSRNCVVSANAVDGCHCGLRVQFRQPLQHMGDTFAPCSRRQSVLVWLQ